METVKLKGVNKLISLNTILYVEGAKEYTRFHFTDGRILRLSMNVAHAHRTLPGFTRIHMSYLVNPEYIQNWRHTDKYQHKALQLTTGIRLPIARERFKSFLATYSKVHI